MGKEHEPSFLSTFFNLGDLGFTYSLGLGEG